MSLAHDRRLSDLVFDKDFYGSVDVAPPPPPPSPYPGDIVRLVVITVLFVCHCPFAELNSWWLISVCILWLVVIRTFGYESPLFYIVQTSSVYMDRESTI
jgi:hypothetical protein